MNACCMHRYVNQVLMILLIIWANLILTRDVIAQDTCIVNDLCSSAILIQQVVSDSQFVFIQGCNVDAGPGTLLHSCAGDSNSTVWYRIITDSTASLMNIKIEALDTLRPVFMVFKSSFDCSTLIEVPLTQSDISCAYGLNGVAQASGTDVDPVTEYFIAVSGSYGTEGSFRLYINTVSPGSVCVLDRNIMITGRSEGGPLTGPFYPGERINVCMNVNAYDSGASGCQWFQGLVPAFGNGWDPSSFDLNGQPLNATINGLPIGETGNGIYGASTWDWFADVGYHYDHAQRQISDIDDNGTLELCNVLFDPDCPDIGGLTGAAFPPCWGDTIGMILPPGWFAYGINGSCAIEGPPIRVDWGDGNSCSAILGAWSFCFDLVVRSFPECTADQSNSHLSLGFFTFSDAEVGSWTGSLPACIVDQPAMLTLPLLCTERTDLGVEFFEDQCPGDLFTYTIEESGIQRWEWSIHPEWAVLSADQEGVNGYTLSDTLINNTSLPIEVTYSFTGFPENSLNTVSKQVKFRLIPEVQTSLPEVIYVCEQDKDSVVLSAEPLSGSQSPLHFLWSPGGDTLPFITLWPPFQHSIYVLNITDTLGCSFRDEVRIHARPCHLDTNIPTDESNDPPTFEDAPVLIGKHARLGANIHSAAVSNALKIFPQPTTDWINIEWPPNVDDAMEIIIFDTRGSMVYRTDLTSLAQMEHRAQVDVGQFAGGVFVVVLQTRDSLLTGKLVKM